MVETRDFFPIRHLHSTPPLGGCRRNIAMTFGTEKLEWCGYPEKNEDAITRFDTIHECDRQQDRRILYDSIGRAYA